MDASGEGIPDARLQLGFLVKFFYLDGFVGIDSLGPFDFYIAELTKDDTQQNFRDELQYNITYSRVVVNYFVNWW